MAVKYRTPVILLSDGYLANGTEPWRLPELDDLPAIDPGFATGPNHVEDDGTEVFWPYLRDEETLARPWAPPGLAGLEHRIGGLEKSDGSGNVAYDGANHERMTRLRAAKIAGIAADIPPDRRRRRGRAPRCWSSAGAPPTAPSPPGCSGSGPAATRSPRPTWSTSTRSRPTSATCSGATGGSWCPR